MNDNRLTGPRWAVNLEDTMKRNEGSLDRIIRLVIAAVAVAGAAALGFGTVGGIVLVVVAAILAVTAATGFCPLYAAFGLNTCPVSMAPRNKARASS